MPTADAATLARLLELQAEDTAIRRLEERRSSLPEAQRLRELSDVLAELEADLDIARKQNDEIAREQARLEGEIGLLDQKTAREEQRMYSGGVSNPKELSALQAEVESLKRKRSGLEDQLLEVMVQKDQAVATLTTLEAEHAAAQAETSVLRVEVAGLNAEIDAELSQHSARRAEIAPDIAPDLLSLYEKIKQAKGGVGAAALERGTCLGCHTKLPQMELERMRAEGGVQRCENCRRIVVFV